MTVTVNCPVAGVCSISASDCELYMTRSRVMPAWVLYECPVCMEWHHTLLRGPNSTRNLAELSQFAQRRLIDEPAPELGAGRPVDIDYAIELHRELERL